TKLPDIHMGVSLYKPKARFAGVFPLNDLLTQAVQQVASFVPGTMLTDIFGAPCALKDLKCAIDKLSEKQKAEGLLLYVKFSYLPEDRMEIIGQRSVSFDQILTTLITRLGPLRSSF